MKTIKNITFINIRVAHEVTGCADKILDFIHEGDSLFHTLIISAPGCGKTTMLRELIRKISDGTQHYHGQTVGVVDERSELGACYMGVPQNNLGKRTDILDCCPKAIGMMMLIRSMAPKVIAIDEIGSIEDIEAIKYVINSGCTIIGTIHGKSYEDISTKPVLKELIEQNTFKRFITLSKENGVGTIKELKRQ